MEKALDWLGKHHEDIVRGLADLVAIPSISTDGEHRAEIDRTAALTVDQMRAAGLNNADVLRVGGSTPPASRPYSCTPITTCSRSTSSSSGSPTRGS
jgi:acetylornithine deacetylase/succinyl-diaminopimelate desuccinylase-like protein